MFQPKFDDEALSPRWLHFSLCNSTWAFEPPIGSVLHFMQFLCRHDIANRASLRAQCAFNAILLYSANFGACSWKFQSGFKAVACRVNPSFMRHALSFSRRRSCDDIYCRDMLATAQHVASDVTLKVLLPNVEDLIAHVSQLSVCGLAGTAKWLWTPQQEKFVLYIYFFTSERKKKWCVFWKRLMCAYYFRIRSMVACFFVIYGGLIEHHHSLSCCCK